MFYQKFIIYMVLSESIAYYERNTKNEIGGKPRLRHVNWTFKDYLKKYNPRTVWEKIDKMKKKGIKLTAKQEIDIFMKGIDMSDDFLRLKVQDGDAKLLVMQDGRRWQPPSELTDFPRDRFTIRRRLFELMKQAIYQARNRMVIMQELRNKYREESLYKMGYLMSKTDNACKTFSKVAFRAFRACILGRQWVMYRHRIYDILSTEERVLNLWFTIELLVDLIKKNDNYLKDLLANGTKHPKKDWIFTDS